MQPTVPQVSLPPPTFSPPPESGWRMGLGAMLAGGAHLLLILALAWGVNWNSRTPDGVEAELWSAVPQIAAPRAATPPPAPTPPPEPVKPPPKPKPDTPPQPTEQELRNAQIAIEKAKQEEQKKKDAERERREKERELEKQREKALEKEREREQEKEREKREAEKKAAADKEKRKEQEEQRKAKEQLEKTEAARQQMLKRMQGQADGTGDPGSAGKAAQSSGPSAGYAGRIKAKVKPNIVFIDKDNIQGNPEADVEVRLAPDGRILSQRIIASSGVKEWDDAVLRAIERTEKLPLDDGKVPSVMVLTFRPKD